MTAVLAVTADLFFRAKIEETARASGAPAPRFAPSAEAVAKLAAEAGDAVVIIEMTARTGGAEGVGVVKAAAPAARIVAFGSHVDTATLDRARALGAVEVMPRSRFVKEMPRLLRGETARGETQAT